MDIKKYKLWDNCMEYIKNRYNNNIFNNLSKESDYVAIIIEPRCHKHLESVIKNFISKLGKKWSMIIFHGNLNKDYIENILGDNHCINLVNLEINNLSVYEYSDILLDINFWNKINSENILIFQTDCLLRNNIDNFLNYDYIGAPWKKDNICLGITKNFIGNGGLSFRKKKSILKILNLIKPTFKSDHNLSEDIFFSKWTKELNMNLPTIKEAKLFSSEQIYEKNCVGLHKIYNYLSYEEVKDLLDFKYF